MRIACKCGGVCDDYGDGTRCDGQVIAINDSPCPRHRCEAHCRKLGFTGDRAAGDAALNFPGFMASFKETDAYLCDRGWVRDGNAWRLMTGRRVIIATGLEALRIQKRKDARKAPHDPPCPNEGVS